ncbi:MAG TPA: outer membrane protein assembly factor BamD [Candidatus Binatia bacterium]|jgi:outer membrane protein assembly factor BamD|nr:outer membrane protein assembly factor BamD [Candidatus Binatia bacterium]
MSRPVAALAVLALVLGGACSTKKPIIPPEKLWGEGTQAFEDEAYQVAIERYKALLDQHPFDPHAEEAELRIAQSYYMAHRYPEAIAAFGDFERMHPTSPNLPEVEYNLGLAYMAQMRTADRDQQPSTNAHTYFKNVIDRWPQSPWAEKARLRLKECRESLAAHEAEIAQYYLRHKNLRAGESRLRYLLSEYPETDATAEALYAFAKLYASRKENEEATLALATLVRYHPDNPLAADARRRLGPDDSVYLDGHDPLPVLMTRIDEMQQQADRQKLPTTVSAYPDTGNLTGQRY